MTERVTFSRRKLPEKLLEAYAKKNPPQRVGTALMIEGGTIALGGLGTAVHETAKHEEMTPLREVGIGLLLEGMILTAIGAKIHDIKDENISEAIFEGKILDRRSRRIPLRGTRSTQAPSLQSESQLPDQTS